MANEYKHIAVYVGTKNRIDALKGRKSYDDVLVDMCTYFETLGITPTSHIASPVLVMKEQSNRVIEVMRGVEKKQNLAINSIYELLKAVSLGAQNKEESIGADDENYMHVDDVKQLLDQYKELKKQNEKTEEKNKLLLNEVEALKQLKSYGNSVDFEDNNILFEIIEKIDSLKKPSTFNNSIYEIDRNSFDAYISRLIEELG
jgi:hypothetical protein